MVWCGVKHGFSLSSNLGYFQAEGDRHVLANLVKKLYFRTWSAFNGAFPSVAANLDAAHRKQIPAKTSQVEGDFAAPELALIFPRLSFYGALCVVVPNPPHRCLAHRCYLLRFFV